MKRTNFDRPWKEKVSMTLNSAVKEKHPLAAPGAQERGRMWAPFVARGELSSVEKWQSLEVSPREVRVVCWREVQEDGPAMVRA